VVDPRLARNLNDEDYAQIGNYMRKAAEEYVAAWKASKK